ncbi:hypothetical protein BG000_002795 [Podila horticola]|nr:hypothetical protein BG000_002795 [Podila horticola]
MFFPYRNIHESHILNYTDVYLEGLVCICESPLATEEQHRIATWLYANVSLDYFLAVFAITERTEAEISRPDAIMALLREPPIFHVELPVEDEGVTTNDEQR